MNQLDLTSEEISLGHIYAWITRRAEYLRQQKASPDSSAKIASGEAKAILTKKANITNEDTPQ